MREHRARTWMADSAWRPDDQVYWILSVCQRFVDVFLRFFGTASGTLIIGNRVGPRSSCFDTLESLDTEFASDWICWIWQEKQLWCCTHDRYAREVCGHISATGNFSWEQCVGFLLVSVSEVTQMTPWHCQGESQARDLMRCKNSRGHPLWLSFQVEWQKAARIARFREISEDGDRGRSKLELFSHASVPSRVFRSA